MNFKFQLAINDAEVNRRLRSLQTKTPGQIVKPAIRAALKPLLAQVRAAARQGKDRTGLLAKSLQLKVVEYKGDRHVVVGMLGPSRDVSGMRGKRKHVPANIAHFVEEGHRIAAYRSGTLPPKPSTSAEYFTTKSGQLVRRVRSQRRAARSKVTGKAGEGRHAGDVKPYPFFGPAWSGARTTVQAKLVEEINTRLNSVLGGGS